MTYPTETKTPSDQDLISKIDKMAFEDLSKFNSFTPKDINHYMEIQKEWLQNQIYFLGIELQQSPSQVQIANHILSSKHTQRFRAFYVLKYSK